MRLAWGVAGDWWKEFQHDAFNSEMYGAMKAKKLSMEFKHGI